MRRLLRRNKTSPEGNKNEEVARDTHPASFPLLTEEALYFWGCSRIMVRA